MLKVAYIDDNEGDLSLGKEILEAKGLAVQAVSPRRKILESLGDLDSDVYLIDMNMGYINAYDLIPLLPRGKRVYIVSGMPEVALQEIREEVGHLVTGVISKDKLQELEL